MNKLVLSISLIGSIFSVAFADQTPAQDLKKIKCTFIIQAGQPQELRKVSTEKIFQGIANSCNQLGKVVSAKGSKDKQQETCNFIAALFQLVADASKKNSDGSKNKPSKEQEDKVKSDTTKNNDEKKEIHDETVSLILGLVNILNDEQSDEVLKGAPSLYLSMLRDLPDDKSRSSMIEQILNDEKESAGFLEEIVDFLNKVIFVSIPEITNNLLESLKNIFKPKSE